MNRCVLLNTGSRLPLLCVRICVQLTAASAPGNVGPYTNTTYILVRQPQLVELDF